MNPAARARAILVDPSAEWTAIESESGDAAFILSRYVAVLALIPALSGFLGVSVIGVVAPGGATLRVPVSDGLFGAVFGYVMACATVLLLGLIVDLLAPLFGGRRDFDSAFKLAVYSFTPVWLAGVFLVLPGLRFLLLTGLYGAYILWLGVPRLIRTKRTLDFTLLIAICAFALIYIAAMAQRMIFGTPGL